jgi:hypothetical protein
MERKSWKTKLVAAVIGVGMAGGVVGCQSNAGTGALLGGAAGAGLGAAVGSHSHGRAGEGALIGGAIGALGGAMIGGDQDRRERERASRYYDDDYGSPRRARTVYRERTYYDDPPPRHDGYYEYRSYRSYDGYGGRSGYTETRRYYDD